MLQAARYFQLKGVDVLSDNLTEPKRGARRGTLRDGPPSARIRRNSMPAYPFRPPMWWIFRIPCAAFGALGLIGVLQDVLYRRDFNTFAFQFLGGGLVAVAWGTFGVYGGFPLVDTVKDWQPPTMPDEITQKHRDGLRVIRRRRWAFGLSFPGYFVLMIAALAIAPNAMEAVFPVGRRCLFHSHLPVLLQPLPKMRLRVLRRVHKAVCDGEHRALPLSQLSSRALRLSPDCHWPQCGDGRTRMKRGSLAGYEVGGRSTESEPALPRQSFHCE
jgi:hypothetical protein